MRPNRSRPHQSNQPPSSSGTATNSKFPAVIVATLEHRRFAEFCDACRRYGYIGLCYGSSGVGKTLSASSYSRWENVQETDRWSSIPLEGPIPDTILYTPSVVNTPRGINADITRSRATLRDLARRAQRRKTEQKLEALHQRDKEHLSEHDWSSGPLPELYPTYEQLSRECTTDELNVADPTTLLVIDEADRLRMASLEQVRSIFDAGGHRADSRRHARVRETLGAVPTVLLAYRVCT